MKKTVIILFSALLLLLCACEQKQTESTPNSTDNATNLSTEFQVDTFDVKTDFVTLCYSKKWEDSVKIETKDGVVSFYAKPDNVLLFDICFDKDDADQIGVLTKDGKNINVGVKTYKIDNNLANYEDYCNMQEDINVIITYLSKNGNFSTDFSANNADVNTEIEDNDEVFGIDTTLTKIYFPKVWEDEVDVLVTDDSVLFSKDNTKLFDLYFGGEDGDLIGKYDGIEIRLMMYDVNDDKLSSIQEGVNTIIENLEKLDGFTAS